MLISFVIHKMRITLIVSSFAILINFLSVNYLTFGGLLSRNAGDFFGSVVVKVDFCEYFDVKNARR